MLYEYEKIAKRLLSKFGYKNLLYDNDSIGAIINALANADLKYDPNLPKKASLETYRTGAFFLAVKRILSSRKNNKMVSLSFDVEQRQEPDINDSVDMEKILSIPTLTNRESTCLKARFIDGKKDRETAKELGVTKQAVSLFVNLGLKKLREHYGKNRDSKNGDGNQS